MRAMFLILKTLCELRVNLVLRMLVVLKQVRILVVCVADFFFVIAEMCVCVCVCVCQVVSKGLVK